MPTEKHDSDHQLDNLSPFEKRLLSPSADAPASVDELLAALRAVPQRPATEAPASAGRSLADRVRLLTTSLDILRAKRPNASRHHLLSCLQFCATLHAVAPSEPLALTMATYAMRLAELAPGCAHPEAHGRHCTPRRHDTRCIWCERSLAP